MTKPSSTDHSWICPSCGRQVPSTIDTCRCGQARVHASQPAPAAARGKPAIPAVVWLAVAALVVLAFWGGYALRPVTPGRGDAAAPAVSPAAAPVAAGESPSVPAAAGTPESAPATAPGSLAASPASGDANQGPVAGSPASAAPGLANAAERTTRDVVEAEAGTAAVPGTVPSDADVSPAEAAREAGTRSYEEEMETMADRADALDTEWVRFRSVCYTEAIGGSFDREWFVLYEPRALRGTLSPVCENILERLRGRADAFRARMAELEEDARRAGVYPGVQRDIRERFGLNYSSWVR